MGDIENQERQMDIDDLVDPILSFEAENWRAKAAAFSLSPRQLEEAIQFLPEADRGKAHEALIDYVSDIKSSVERWLTVAAPTTTRKRGRAASSNWPKALWNETVQPIGMIHRAVIRVIERWFPERGRKLREGLAAR